MLTCMHVHCSVLSCLWLLLLLLLLLLLMVLMMLYALASPRQCALPASLSVPGRVVPVPAG